jgi:steroid 5-alpha reductase family enzyme
MMATLQAFLTAGLVLFLMLTALWLVSLALKDASLIDSFWGPGFAVATLIYFAMSAGWAGRKVLVSALVLLWGLRLGLHILRRNWGRGEDFRYQTWRRQYGARYWWVSFFQVFMLQGVLLWLISTPLLMGQSGAEPSRFTLLDGTGALAWGVGMFFEAVGDWQLARFKSDPANKGQVMTSGLWRYTRHPNYFGDACVWWGFFLIACSVPWGWLTVFAPMLMTVLLLRVSGVAMLEQTMLQRPGYSEYAARTSAFLPWPPRK